MKRVIIFFPSWGLGGSTLYLSQFVSYFLDKNYEVFCICRRKDKGSDFLKDMGAKVFYSHIPISLSFTAESKHDTFTFKQIVKGLFKFVVGLFVSIYFLIKIRPTIILIGEFTLLQIMLACLLAGKKYTSFIQTDISANHFKRKIVNFFMNRSANVISITKLHNVGFDFKAINVVHNTPKISNQGSLTYYDESFLDQINGKKVITFIGGTTRIKGIVSFIRIGLEILKLRRDVIFLVIGNCSKNNITDSYYDSLVNNSDIKEKLIFIGETNNVDYYLQSSSLYISTNEYAHFSRPIIEAWKNGVPVVAFKDKYTEYMDSNFNSILFIDRDNILNAATNIHALLNDKNIIDSFVMHGSQNYLENYSIESCQSAIQFVFKKR